MKELLNIDLYKRRKSLKKAPFMAATVFSLLGFSSSLYANNTWTLTGDLNNPRAYHTSTTLNSSQVLVTGGDMDSVLLNSAEILDINASKWSFTASMQQKRQKHIAILLDDGRVLVAGGRGASSDLASAEIYDPATSSWSIATSMASPRVNALVTKLKDGRVLVSSGTAAGVALNSAEIYDPASNTWTSTAGMVTDAIHTNAAVLLNDGRVFIKGDSGYINGPSVDPITPIPPETPKKLPQIYDPLSNSWNSASPMNTPKRGGTSIVLNDGTVLVVGGDKFVDDSWGYPYFTCDVPAEIYHPDTDTWSITGTLVGKRDASKVSLLPDGRVLAFGPNLVVDAGYGCGADDRHTEIYDPATGTWSVTDSANLRHDLGGTKADLPDGKVLSIGGNFMKNITEVYTPSGPSPISPTRSQTMHVGDLDAISVENTDGSWTAFATVTVLDENNQPVYKADVSIGTGCFTDYLGQCTVESTTTLADRHFKVNDIKKSFIGQAITYDVSANTDPDGDSDGTTIVVQRDGTTSGPIPPPPPNVHVGDLDGSSVKDGKKYWQATVSVTIKNRFDEPRYYADVFGVWSGGASGTASCRTNTSGVCEMTSGRISNTNTTAVFTVTNVVENHYGWEYDSTLNSDPDGDSNGTTITIVKP